MRSSPLRPGDHVSVSRGAYSHHGIFIGEGTIIHYSGEVLNKTGASVRSSALDTFASGRTVTVVQYGACDAAPVVVRRARSRLGECDYELIGNNCEHFARWCKTGTSQSEQVRNSVASAAGASGVALAAMGSVGVVSAAGISAGLSGAGLLSGLAAVGGLVGAGAVGGVALLASAPVALSAASMRAVLADGPALPSQERVARKVGRLATMGGGVAGVAGSVAAISSMGSVAGLSGPGIATGLAAIGGTIGGGMVAGFVVTVAAPAVVSSAVGYVAYRVLKVLVAG